MADSLIGKDAEKKIKEWLDHKEKGYCFDRIKDQMTGFFGSQNICDFTLYKYPYKYYIESKATWEDRFDFSMISEYQFHGNDTEDGMVEKAMIPGVYGLVIVLFASYQRAFVISILEIERLRSQGIKSLNITKIDKWPSLQYKEIRTIPNNRKKLLDYEGEIEEYIS